MTCQVETGLLELAWLPERSCLGFEGQREGRGGDARGQKTYVQVHFAGSLCGDMPQDVDAKSWTLQAEGMRGEFLVGACW